MRSTVVVSLRSRGIPCFTPSALLDWRHQVIELSSAITDLLTSAFITFSNLTWTSWLSIVISIATTARTLGKYNSDGNPETSQFFPLFAFVVLPLLILLYLVFTRRDRAQAAVGRFKVAYTSLYLQASAFAPASLPAPVIIPPPTAWPRQSLPTGQYQPDSQVTAPTQLTTGPAPGSFAPGGQAGMNGPGQGDVPLPHLVEPVTGLQAAADDLLQVLQLLLDDLHKYLAHKRPYARHFYIPYQADSMVKDTMYKVSRELSILGRRMQRSLREAIVRVGCMQEQLATTVPTAASHRQTHPQPSQASQTAARQPSQTASQATSQIQGMPQLPGMGAVNTPWAANGMGMAVGMGYAALASGALSGQLPDAVAAAAAVCMAMPTSMLLSQQVVSMHEAIEQLVAVKEQRTPVLLRAMVRWFVVAIMPIFMSWYWLSLARTVNAAIGGILAVFTHIALLVLLDVAIALEDPFDEAALDAVSLFEMLDQLSMLTTCEPDGMLDWVAASRAAAAESAGQATKVEDLPQSRQFRGASVSHVFMPPMPPPATATTYGQAAALGTNRGP